MSSEIFTFIREGSLTAGLVWALVGGFLGWWVFGPVHTRAIKSEQDHHSEIIAIKSEQLADSREQRDRLETILETTVNALETAMEQIEQLEEQLKGEK